MAVPREDFDVAMLGGTIKDTEEDVTDTTDDWKRDKPLDSRSSRRRRRRCGRPTLRDVGSRGDRSTQPASCEIDACWSAPWLLSCRL